MASKPQNSQKTVHVEYCRSCDTHNWCTHHDEAKYHDTFLKLTELIAQNFPQLEVIGNMVPPHLIPFKISENKYIDSQTNKYVVYPQIGSFQVRFNNATVYSKKDNNAWPNLQSIVSKIGSILDPNYKSPPKLEKPSNSPKKEVENTLTKEVQNSRLMKSEDEKIKVYKDQSKGFTLTDHFKLYKPKTKIDDKDWLTEKQQSEGSFKQFSQPHFRGESREKSDQSQESRKRRDFNGQTKLKQMLKSRGLMLKQQGKKEMIIKLDSIEQENANYEEGNGATQRTQEYSNKRNKMQELEDEFSSLENRFKNFENKVHDIHTKNRQFQYKQEPSNEHSRVKNGQARNEESTRKQSKKQQVAQKENYYFYERASKLDEYLNATQQEKNQKLHKIYGEWKYLKQTAQKNKKFLKNRKRNSQEPLSSDQESQTHSNSPSYMANVITFKPKKDKSTPKLVGPQLSKEKGHKYSTLEKYDSNKVLVTEPKFRTGEQFYNKNIKNQPNLNTDTDQQARTTSKMLKKGLGTMSMQALKKYASKEALLNLERPQAQDQEISQFSQTAQKNIKQIQSRINHIQSKLKMQKESQQTPYFGRPTLEAIKNVYSNKSRSNSQASNYSAKQQNKRQTKEGKGKNDETAYRNSYRHPNDKNFRNIAKIKAENKQKSRVSQAPSNQYKKQAISHSQTIEQQSELIQSNNHSANHSKRSPNDHRQHQNRSSNKKSPNNQKLLSKEKGNRESTKNLRTAAFNNSQEKTYKVESNKIFNVTQPKKIRIGKHSQHDQQRISKVQTDVTQYNEHYHQKTEKSPQKDSRIHQYPLHEQVTYLRKKKDWRESQPVKKNKKERTLRESEQEELSQSNNNQDRVEESERTSKLSDSKHTVTKGKNKMKSTQRENSNTPKKPKAKHMENTQVGQEKVKSQFGRIRKNKSREQDTLRSSERQSQDRQRYDQREEVREQYDDDEQGQYQDPEEQQEEVEGQEMENESQSAQNQQIYNQSEVLQKSQPQIRGTETSTKPVQKLSSKSQKAQIKKNRVNNLSYYKSEQICYEGAKKEQTASNHQSQLSSDKPREAEYERGQPGQEQNSGKSIENGVSGWKLNSQEEGESDPIIMNRQSAKTQEEVEVYEQGPHRRNSLDLKLQNNLSNQQQELKEEEQKQIRQPIHSQQVPKHMQQCKQTQGGIKNANEQQKVAQNISDQAKLEKQKGQQLVQPQKSETPAKAQKSKKAKKQKQPKGTTASHSAHPNAPKQQPQVELQSLIAKQYADYLTQKLADTLLKQGTQLQPIRPAKVQTTEAKQYEDCNIAINLNFCPSISSIATHRQIAPLSFMDYQPAPQAKVQAQSQPTPQQQQQYQEQDGEDSESQQVQSQQDKEQLPLEGERVEANQVDAQDKEVQRYVKKVNDSVITNICPITPTQKQNTLVNQLQEKQQTTVVNTAPITSTNQPTVVQKETIKDKQPLTQEPNVVHKETIKEDQPLLVETTPTKLATTPTKIPQQSLKQENNVYSQAKEVSKYKEIGIQKELTLEVSVQTDHPPQDMAVDVLMVRANSVKSNEVYNPPTSRQSQKRKVQLVQSIFEQPNPVKNNYFSQSKRQSLFHKKKPAKQIERAHIIEKIYSSTLESQFIKFANLLAGIQQDIHKQEGPVVKITECYLQGELFSPKTIQPELVQTKFTRLLKVVEILCEKSEWLITRLFQDKNGVLKDKAFGVWLCKQYQWQCIILDDSILVNEDNHPLYSIHSGNQMWFNVLEKAVAIALGGYGNLMKAETAQLFTLLTGCNAIVSKVKEDPTKNSKLLSLINDCLRKNYVIHAQKSDKSKKQQTKENVYYINSIRKAGGDEETLIELSQNGRESFWIKLSRFVQEFCKIEILQLRINHNFAHLDLGVGRPGQLTVVQLQFQEDAQGCVTLSYLGESGALRAFLYKQEKNKVLKLVGQAKQKSKSHLFFQCSFTQGKYYVFAQAEQRPSRLLFLGQSHPRLQITEQIHSQGLKNEMAEYLPVRQNEDIKPKRSEYETQNDWRGRTPRLQDNFVESRLRQNFIDYVLGKSKR